MWDARVVAPLDQAMIDDAARHELVVTVEDGIADGGVGWKIAESLRGAAPAGIGPVVVNCGVPSAFLPHGTRRASWHAWASTAPGSVRSRSSICELAARRPLAPGALA